MSTEFGELCSILDKIICSHKESINKNAKCDDMEKTAGEIFQTLDEKNPYIVELENVGEKIVQCFSKSIDETEKYYEGLNSEEKTLFIKMFEAKVLEAMGQSDNRPDNHDEITKLNNEKLNRLMNIMSKI